MSEVCVIVFSNRTLAPNPPTLLFRSTLNDNGRRRPLHPRIENFLRHDGAVLAAVLRCDTPLSQEAIHTACQEYVTEHPEMAPLVEEQVLNTILTRFVYWRLAEVVFHIDGEKSNGST